MIQQHISRGQRRMAAEVDLSPRREPAQMIRRTFLDDKCRLRKAVLHRNVLHQRIGNPMRKNAHGGWIPGENMICKSVYDELPHI